MNSRSKNRNVCWKRPEYVSLAAVKIVAFSLRAVSRRYSSPNVLVDHFWTWN